MLSHNDVIDAFGGVTKLARTLGVDPKRANHWPHRGIPAKYWPCIEETEVGISLGITARRLKRLPVAVPEQAAA